MQELLDFAKLSLEYKGSVIERGDDILSAVIPEEVARELEMSEFETFTVNSDPAPGETPLAYGSDALEKLLSIIKDMGYTTCYLMPFVEFKKAVTENDILRQFEFSNAKFQSVSVTKGHVPYLLFNFKWTVISDMRRDGLFSCVINQLTGSRVREIEKVFSQRPVIEYAHINDYVFEGKPVEEAFKKACCETRLGIEDELTDFRKSMMRRMQRDIRRVEDYYNGLIGELRKKRPGKKDVDELIADLKNKEKVIKLELKAKRSDLLKKYTTKVNIDLISVARIYLPSAAADIKILFKKFKPIFRTCWNPITKDLEDLICDGCLRNTSHIYLCPHQHLLCEKCHGLCVKCGRRYCKVCHGDKFPCDCK